MKASQTIASQIHHNERGQALAELIIACGVLAIILFGIVTTINFSVNAVTISANKTLAVYYAQEVLEYAHGLCNQSWIECSTSSNYDSLRGQISGTIFTRTITVANDAAVAAVIPASKQNRVVTSRVEWRDGTQVYATVLSTALVQP